MPTGKDHETQLSHSPGLSAIDFLKSFSLLFVFYLQIDQHGNGITYGISKVLGLDITKNDAP